jgi:hypothetical protein
MWQDTKSTYKNLLAFLYTNNEQIEKEYMKTNSIYNCLKNKYPEVNFKKDMDDLYKENYKPLKKEI